MKAHRFTKVTVAAIALLVAASMAAGCHKPARMILTKDQQMRIKEAVLSEAPAPQHVVNANFGDNVELLGVDMRPETPAVGQEVTVTWYWHCKRTPQPGWKVFVHVELPKGKRIGLDHIPVGELYPMDKWVPGQYVKYSMTFRIDSKQETGRATIWAGLFAADMFTSRGSGERMIVVNRDEVKHDGENRVRVADFDVIKAAATREAPELKLTVNPMVGTAPVIDGVMDEEAWKGAAVITRLNDAFGKPIVGEETTSVAVTYDKDFIYFGIQATDLSVEADLKNRDDQLWTQDVFEIYLDALADAKNYLEIQISPANVIFDALFESHRTPKWEDAMKHNVPGMVTAVKVDGTLNKKGDVDRGWTMEVKIPVASIPDLKEIVSGTKLRANFYRMNLQDGQMARAHAWGPGGRDFHDLDKAGILEFSTVVPTVGGKPIDAPAAGQGAAPAAAGDKPAQAGDKPPVPGANAAPQTAPNAAPAAGQAATK